jgi:hypothetical protein
VSAVSLIRLTSDRLCNYPAARATDSPFRIKPGVDPVFSRACSETRRDLYAPRVQGILSRIKVEYWPTERTYSNKIPSTVGWYT